MKVEELIGTKVWIKSDQFRSVPGEIKSMSNTVNLDDIKSSVSQSTFRVEMLSGEVIEMPGSDIAEIDHAGYVQETRSA
jgi:hypothetical protein